MKDFSFLINPVIISEQISLRVYLMLPVFSVDSEVLLP